MTTTVRTRLAAVVAGAGLFGGVAAAGDCPTGKCCRDKKVYPKLEHFYIKKFCGPTIAPGSCFGYFKPKVTPWEVACPGGCDPYESVYPSNGPVPSNAAVPESPPPAEPGAKPTDSKAAEPKKPETTMPAPTPPPAGVKPPVEPAPLPKPPTVPLIDPKKEKDAGKSSRLDAPRIVLPPAPTTPVTTTVPTGVLPTLLPPVVSR